MERGRALRWVAGDRDVPRGEAGALTRESQRSVCEVRAARGEQGATRFRSPVAQVATREAGPGAASPSQRLALRATTTRPARLLRPAAHGLGPCNDASRFLSIVRDVVRGPLAMTALCLLHASSTECLYHRVIFAEATRSEPLAPPGLEAPVDEGGGDPDEEDQQDHAEQVEVEVVAEDLLQP